MKRATKKLTSNDLNANIYLSDDNKKLKGDEKNHFLIWSIPAVVTCHWRTALCEEHCYALKAEIQYPDVNPCRTRNWQEAEKESFVQDISDHITWNMTSRPSLKGKKIWFRIHESGDFYSLEYLKKWIAIARKFPNITFLAYTKAVRLIEMVIKEIPSNFVIRYSVWEDTKPEELEIATRLNLPIFTAFEKKILDAKVKEEKYKKCLGSCQKCKKCYTRKNAKIAIAIH